MGIYGFYTARKMYAALKKSSDKIGDINAQVEDTLAGIRVVKSFTMKKSKRKNSPVRIINSSRAGGKDIRPKPISMTA